MPKDAYPTGSDLGLYLAEFGIVVTDSTLLDTLAAAGVQRFEEATSRHFLAGAAEARTYDPPGTPLLDLEDDLAALVSIEYQPQGSAAQAFVTPDDYRLLPQNAAAKGKPWEWVQFRRTWWMPMPPDLQSSLTVTGAWGYGTTIPEAAWLAMLAAGAAPLWDKTLMVDGALRGPLTAWTEGNSREQYGSLSGADIAALREGFLGSYPTAVALYQKVIL